MNAPQSAKVKYKVLVCGATHTGKTSIIRRYVDDIFTSSFFPTILPIPSPSKVFNFSDLKRELITDKQTSQTKHPKKSTKKTNKDIQTIPLDNPSTSQPSDITETPSCFELSIWDTAGTEEYESFNTTLFHGIRAVVFVASYDDTNSLTDVTTKWRERIASNTDIDNLIRVLAVNKTDLLDGNNEKNDNKNQQINLADTKQQETKNSNNSEDEDTNHNTNRGKDSSLNIADDSSIEQARSALDAKLFKVSAKNNSNINEMFEFIAKRIWESDNTKNANMLVQSVNDVGNKDESSEKKRCC